MITAVTQLGGSVAEWTVTAPITLTEFKAHSRIDTSADDTWATDAILRATDWVQRSWTNRQLVSATYTLYLPTFPGGKGLIRVPRPPLISVQSVKYYDANATLQTFAAASYQVNIRPAPGTIRPVVSAVWPLTEYDRDNAVEIAFTAGWASAATVPASIKQAVCMLASHWYENREASIVGTISKETELGVKMLLAPFRAACV